MLCIKQQELFAWIKMQENNHKKNVRCSVEFLTANGTMEQCFNEWAPTFLYVILISYNMQNHRCGYWSAFLARIRMCGIYYLRLRSFWHLVDFSLTSPLPKLTLFSPFLRKPSSPKSDDSLTVNLTHDTEVYNAATGSLVLLFYAPLTVFNSHHLNSHLSFLLPQQSRHVSCCSCSNPLSSHHPCSNTHAGFMLWWPGHRCLCNCQHCSPVVDILFKFMCTHNMYVWAYCLCLSVTLLHVHCV